MYWIDELRVKSMVTRSKVREVIATFLIKLAFCLHQEHVRKCCIGTKIEMDVEKYMPNDGKWHHIAMTMDYWIRLCKNFEKEQKEETAIFIDGTKQEIL